MAVANTFTFGSVSSAAYGVVLEGPGEYTAPVRATKMINVPGRNGALVIDLGYYENVDAEYHCVIQADTQSAFESAVADFRNAIVGQIGYQRLEDTYHAGEYREAIYVGGFDEEADFHGRSAIFTLKFSCKPQRFVADGQTEITIASGGTVVTNPSPFDAHPLIEAWGSGIVDVGGNKLQIESRPLGYIQLASAGSQLTKIPARLINFSPDIVATGDKMTLQLVEFSDVLPSERLLSSYEILDSTGVGSVTVDLSDYSLGVKCQLQNLTFTAETATDAEHFVEIRVTDSGGNTSTISFDYHVEYSHESDPDVEQFMIMRMGTSVDGWMPIGGYSGTYIQHSAIMCDSHANAGTLPTYIDCDIGEAYKLIDDYVASRNIAVSLGVDLPVLVPGSTTVSYSGNITALKVIPRWWQL
jgi:phage-related protein